MLERSLITRLFSVALSASLIMEAPAPRALVGLSVHALQSDRHGIDALSLPNPWIGFGVSHRRSGPVRRRLNGWLEFQRLSPASQAAVYSPIRIGQYSWETKEKAIANIRDAFLRNRPDIQRAYDALQDDSPEDAKELLRREICALGTGHLQLWGIDTVFNRRTVPYFEGRFSRAMQAAFPALDLNELDFELQWKTPEQGIASVRHVFQKKIPDVMQRYERWSELSELERRQLQDDVYALTNSHFRAWGLFAAVTRKLAPYFDASFIRALQAVFPDLHLHPLGFELRWRTPQERLTSVRFVLERERPDLMRTYERWDDLDSIQRRSFQRQVYQITDGHMRFWKLDRSLSRERSPEFGGFRAGVFRALFPAADLDPIGFESDFRTPERQLATFRFLLRWEAPDLMERYDRIESLSESELHRLRSDVYSINRALFDLWGLGGIWNQKNLQNADYVSQLMRVFEHPLLNYSHEAVEVFRKANVRRQYDWKGGLEASLNNFRDALRRQRPELLRQYERFRGLDDREREALRDEVYQLTNQHMRAWGVSAGVNRQQVPELQGSHVFILQSIFPELELNPLGFQFDHSSPESSMASIRYLIERRMPHVMKAVRRLPELTEPEIEAVRRQFYRITVGHMRMWGMGTLPAFFEGSVANAFVRSFPELNLNPVGFRFQWETPEEAAASILFAFQANVPALIRQYERLDELTDLERRKLENDIYRIRSSDLSFWGLSSALDKRQVPFLNGDSANVVQAAFPKLALNPLGFRLDFTSEERSLESLRYVVSREAPDLLERYGRLEQMEESEIDDLRNDIYSLTQAHIIVWGAARAFNVPWFGASYFNILLAVFNAPRLGLERRGFEATVRSRVRSPAFYPLLKALFWMEERVHWMTGRMLGLAASKPRISHSEAFVEVPYVAEQPDSWKAFAVFFSAPLFWVTLFGSALYWMADPLGFFADVASPRTISGAIIGSLSALMIALHIRSAADSWSDLYRAAFVLQERLIRPIFNDCWRGDAAAPGWTSRTLARAS